MCDDFSKYSISKEIEFEPLEIIDLPEIIASCKDEWQNITLSKVNDCVIRLGVIQGKFHWHKHDEEDEFFYVIDGQLYIDLEDRIIILKPQQGFLVPRKIKHRTRAPKRTSILMIEGSTVEPTGDK